MNIEKDGDHFIFQCPHCADYIVVKASEINCKIFRHGVMKDNLQQVSPHAPKDRCDYLKENDLIYGCGKPFKFDGKSVEICDYI